MIHTFKVSRDGQETSYSIYVSPFSLEYSRGKGLYVPKKVHKLILPKLKYIFMYEKSILKHYNLED